MEQKTTRAETAQARRQLIVETAAACFVEQGFHQTSIRDIARRAGISLGNLYNHFDNKAALIAEIAMLEEKDLDAIDRRVSQVSSPSKAFDRFLALYIEYCSIPENILLAAEITAEGLRNQQVASGFKQNHARLTAMIAKLISDLAAHQRSRPVISPQVSADFVVDLVQGLAMRCAFAGKKPTRAELTALKTAIARFSLA